MMGLNAFFCGACLMAGIDAAIKQEIGFAAMLLGFGVLNGVLWVVQV